ncbi:hypothetical protein HKT18_13675 [Flavobacterium sp. IMCC34852]|uniref:Uncharacterized protein n=1 Tax=Flavobacterium rivulicola TaxID=2732161 RepID=A0A7Y3VZZ7_9FLAO|nr:hypothetical protein [Flavobacterium sp. IMCC34852]NNT73264.1 hypothetical protein [Flavobacterium sp. IMCC34852]
MEEKKSNKLWIGSTIILLIFIYFIPKEIAYPKYKYLVWFVFILIFGVVPYFVYNIIKRSNQNFSSIKVKGICALSILIVGPTYAIFQNYRENEALRINGKVTECIVVDRKKSKNDWLINCKYLVKNSEFMTYYHIDEKGNFQIGDTLKLIYNEEFPRMYKIDF